MRIRIQYLLIFFFAVIFSSCEKSEGEPNSPEQPIEEEITIAAFPGAEGFGKFTTGGRGGKIKYVTNLNNSGPGSLRDAINSMGARYVLFKVSGTIELQSTLEINNGDITIAGQTAPGDGITLKNHPLIVKASNVIIRYIRSRLGDEKQILVDAITITNQKNIIIDHCSFSWGTDETASFYDNENFTLQWSIISEGLNKSGHGYGGMWGGKGASFHHNLLAHFISRFPRFNGARYHGEPQEEVVDHRNNIIYNWVGYSAYGGEEGNHNIINNFYKYGPATKEESRRNTILSPFNPFGKFYVNGNYVVGSDVVTNNNYLGVKGDYPESTLLSEPVDVISIPSQTAEEAYNEVLNAAGASYVRDEVDSRIVEEVRTGTATYGIENDGIIDSQLEVGGWPELGANNAPVDSDNDGMPDEWEDKKGLDKDNGDDPSEYSLDENYPNIEVYLNEIIE